MLQNVTYFNRAVSWPPNTDFLFSTGGNERNIQPRAVSLTGRRIDATIRLATFLSIFWLEKENNGTKVEEEEEAEWETNPIIQSRDPP